MVDKTLKSLVGEFIENNGLVKGASSYLLKLTNETQHSHEVFKEFKNIVSEIDSLYPGIDNWFDKKVIPGINNGKRHAFLMMHNGRAIAETIVKFGNDSKLCSMRIKPSFQNYSLGILLFAEVAKALGNKSHSVHFTAPESLTLQRKGLFRRLGFRCIGKSSRIYRKGEDEFVFHASTVEF